MKDYTLGTHIQLALSAHLLSLVSLQQQIMLNFNASAFSTIYTKIFHFFNLLYAQYIFIIVLREIVNVRLRCAGVRNSVFFGCKFFIVLSMLFARIFDVFAQAGIFLFVKLASLRLQIRQEFCSVYIIDSLQKK